MAVGTKRVTKKSLMEQIAAPELQVLRVGSEQDLREFIENF